MMAFITPTPAGELRQRVTILKPQTGAVNELNELNGTMVPTLSVWAKVSPISAEKQLLNAQITEKVTHVVRMRYVPFITSTCALQYQGSTLSIYDVRDVENEHTELVLTCIQEVGDAGAR